MSGHRVELNVTFTVGDPGREQAEAVVSEIENIGFGRPRDDDDDWPSDFEVTPLSVDGNDWHVKWPPRSKPVTLKKRTPAGAVEYLADVLEAAIADGADERTIRTAVAGAVMSLRMFAGDLAEDE